MRQMSPWRDWVIEAFNRNMPVDEFITWQLAGDLLPDPTPEQRLATAFNRNHMQSQEGGIVSEEYRVEYVADRVNTFGSAFLGLTLQCARCHDHKYDPVLQKDYFKLFAFFNNVNETGQIPYSGMPSPTVTISTPEADTAIAALREKIGPLEEATRVDRLATGPAFEAWLAKAQAVTEQPPVVLPRPIVHLPLDAMKAYTFANLATPRRMGTVGGEEERKKKTARAPEVVPGVIGNAVRLVGDSQIDLGGRDENFGFFERNDPFSFAIWIRRDKASVGGPVITRSGAVMNGHRGYELILRPDGTLTAGLHHVAPDNSLEIETVTPMTVGDWYHIAVTYDGSSRATGLRLYVNGVKAPTRVMTDNLARSIISEPLGRLGWDLGDPPRQARRREPVGRLGRRVLRLPGRTDRPRGCERWRSPEESADSARHPAATSPAERRDDPSSETRRPLGASRRASQRTGSGAVAGAARQGEQDHHPPAAGDGDARPAGGLCAPDFHPGPRFV